MKNNSGNSFMDYVILAAVIALIYYWLVAIHDVFNFSIRYFTD